MKNIDKIVCSCGGIPVEVPTNDAEEKEHGRRQRQCCVGAYQCDKCKVRWTFAFLAPDFD